MIARFVAPLLLAVLMSGEACAQRQDAVAYGSLPPIDPGYKARIVAWAKGYFVDMGALRQPMLSDPVLIRDSTGRLLWLVCLDVQNTATTPPPLRSQRQAFGFGINGFTAPEERLGSSLTYQTCDEQSPSLVYRPFPQLVRR